MSMRTSHTTQLGNTLLHLSVELGDEKMVMAAVQSGADPFIENFMGNTIFTLTLPSLLLFIFPFHKINSYVILLLLEHKFPF